MSTRAIIAMPTGTDPLPSPTERSKSLLGRLFGLTARPRFVGVYHHNGGVPDELGSTIFELVNDRYARDVARFHREIIADNPAGWSSIHALGDPTARKSWDGRSKITAQQHFDSEGDDSPLPVTYQGDPRRDLGFRAPPVTESTQKMGADYVYVVCRDELVIYGVGSDGVSVREGARVRWESVPEWDAIRETVDRVFEE